MTDKEIDRIIKANIKMAGFISLVKRMRKAQKGIYQAFTTSPKEVVDWSVDKARQLESEVDEYLKKMESIDQRKALEAENTEFEYGHNVKHYRED